MNKLWLRRKWLYLKGLLWEPSAGSHGSIRHPEDIAQFLRTGSVSDSNIIVNTETAMRQSTVNSCVKILAESLGSLPLIIYRRRPDGGKDRAVDHPLFNLLKNKPNSWQTSTDWRKMLMNHLTLQGNAYCWLNRVGGVVRELVPLAPTRVEVTQTRTGRLFYDVWSPEDAVRPRARRVGNPQRFNQREILHIRNISSNGIVGRSTLSDARNAMGLALSEERFASRTFGSGATPSGVLEHPEQLGPEARAELKKSFDDTYGGQAGTGGTLVLEEGMKWSAVSISPQDAQFIESRRFSIADIARFFRMPLHLLQELERSTNNNIEQQSLEFVIYTLMPWLVNWEQVYEQMGTWRTNQRFLVEGRRTGCHRRDKCSLDCHINSLENYV